MKVACIGQSSPGRDSEEKAKKQKTNKSKKINKEQPHIIRVGQEKHPPQQATQERQEIQPFKQRKTTRTARQGQVVVIYI